MNWDAMAAVAETVGGAGVIATLIYLAVQVRQNTRSVRAATYDAMVRSSGDFRLPLIQDARLAKNFEQAVEDWDKLDAEYRASVMYILTQLFRIWENAYFQHRQNTLEPGLWAAWRGVMLSYFHQPGVQEWWKYRAHAYSAEFRELLESSPPPAAGIRTTQQIHDASSEAV